MEKISIIIPARNEEDVLEDTVKSISEKVRVPFEILIINDNSTDSTRTIAENLSKDRRINIINRKENPGFGNSIKEGFKNAKGFAVIPVMADLCDDPKTINKMYKEIGKVDIVCGCRYIKGGKSIGAPKTKKFVSKNYGRLMRFFLGIPTKDISNAFKMYRKEVIENIDIGRNDFSISVEIPLKAYFKGFKIKDVPTFWRGREKGESKFKILKMAKSYLSLFLFGLKKKVFR